MRPKRYAQGTPRVGNVFPTPHAGKAERLKGESVDIPERRNSCGLCKKFKESAPN